jgi:Transposase IS66 family
MLEEIDPNQIEDPVSRQMLRKVLNLLEESYAQNGELRSEIERLRAEIARLKGEQAKPNIRPPSPNWSSEGERHKPRPGKKGSKQAELVVTRTETVKVARGALPKDAEFKGYETVLVQELNLAVEVICFKKEKFYSPSTRQSYLATLPPGYRGQYGPGVKALVLYWYYHSGISEPKIKELLSTFGLAVSAGEISDWLITENAELLEQEKQAIVRAGLASTSWHHFDHTGTRAIGENQACHILCNPYYTAFFTLPKRDRLSLLRVLLGGTEPNYCYNAKAQELLTKMGLAKTWLKRLTQLPLGVVWQRAELSDWLACHCPQLNQDQTKLIYDALAIAAYQGQSEWAVVQTLVCDDAPQFNYLTQELALCWVHAGRHFKKLTPRLAYHQKILEAFTKQFWQLYDRLLAYHLHPTAAQAERLEGQFDRLFTEGGEYSDLDRQIAKTRANKAHLLLILKHPYLPLHNNPAELGARQRVRKLAVSLAAATSKGLAAWDAVQTIVATATKLGVNCYHYFLDRLKGIGAMPGLADLIKEKAKTPWSYQPSAKSLALSQKRRATKGTGGLKPKPAKPPPNPTPTKEPKPAKPKRANLDLCANF